MVEECVTSLVVRDFQEGERQANHAAFCSVRCGACVLSFELGNYCLCIRSQPNPGCRVGSKLCIQARHEHYAKVCRIATTSSASHKVHAVTSGIMHVLTDERHSEMAGNVHNLQPASVDTHRRASTSDMCAYRSRSFVTMQVNPALCERVHCWLSLVQFCTQRYVIAQVILRMLSSQSDPR